MPDTAPGLDTELADDIAKGRRQQARRRTVAALVVLAVAVVLGVLTVALDWGWVVWRLSLGLAAIALAVASLRLGRLHRVAAVITAVALVAAGVLLVRIPPIAQPGWTVGEHIRLVAAAGDVAVTLDPSTGRLQGHQRSNGDNVWQSESLGLSDLELHRLGGDGLLVYSGSERHHGQAAVVSLADGKTTWRQDVGDQAPFTANDDVVVVTSEVMTTGLDLRSGRKVWSTPGRATAGSGGQSSYSPRRWVPRSDWIAMESPTSKRLPATVLDAGTGQPAAVVRAKSADFVIAGATFIEFGYDQKGRRIAQGTPLAGGRPWSAELPHSSVKELLDVVDGKARALYSNQAVFITPETGAVQTVRIEDDWSVAWFAGRIGGRYAVVEQRDPDHRVTAQTVADTVTGDVLRLPGRGHAVDLELAEFSADKAFLHTSVVDAVGGDADRYTVVEKDSAQVAITVPDGIPGSADEHFDAADDVIQVNRRIVPLAND
ncbi:putative pyrroloquinoline-quinone binding quinoprotein [Kribbella voronezhensis]|uniref:Putative pyrroloquinoline-quinone binding quinoprotein n=1 Tax=Kribbella voronezhensis TaxID=2512212 RepID=A0A4R7SUH1_9ACTN|nr:PQQ-binding-like beta-propeller repeat protein [Kribbella voronezhensis]TDU82419.1 putative pyrroloquinoline-quinone binding quinoprotein [Kribbella voronezhensis]